ncbi:MAG: 3-dehydroquinate synthase [Firmicutes bacterium]|nr:3-dehydroquinate synthase [Bacillota bacterium]
MKKTIHVDTARPYDVHIGAGLLDQLAELLPEKIRAVAGRGGKAVLLTDEHVNPLYGDRTAQNLSALGFQVLRTVVPAGETAKSGDCYLRQLSFMAENHVSRQDVIFALGGGVVGDLSGFLAATYQRGIPFVQLPTTLLSAVDSSVGGKTAINLPEGKNLVGAFYQPAAVIMDTDTLDTLEPSVFADGCAEVIKYGMIWDAKLYRRLAEKVLPACRSDKALLAEIIAACVDIKRQVVVQDELDKGLRNLLNFGHTIGHSIEKNSGFEISHGSAVAMGMAMVTKAAEEDGTCEAGTADGLKKLLEAYGLPTEAPFTTEQLLAGMLSDKKIEGREINLILPRKIGDCFISHMDVAQAQKLLAGGKA